MTSNVYSVVCGGQTVSLYSSFGEASKHASAVHAEGSDAVVIPMEVADVYGPDASEHRQTQTVPLSSVKE